MFIFFILENNQFFTCYAKLLNTVADMQVFIFKVTRIYVIYDNTIMYIICDYAGKYRVINYTRKMYVASLLQAFVKCIESVVYLGKCIMITACVDR